MKKGNLSNPSGAHLNETIFRSYEQWFLQLEACYPEPLTIAPAELRAVTFAAQMRTAANAFLQGTYESPIEKDKFRLIWKDVVVRVVSSSVVISQRGTSVKEATGIQTSLTPSTYFTVLKNPTLDQLNAICTLHSSGATSLPSLIEGEIPFDFTCPETLILQAQPDGTHLLL